MRSSGPHARLVAPFGLEKTDDFAGNPFESYRRADGILAPEQGGPNGGADETNRPARPELTVVRKGPTGFEVQVVDPEILVRRAHDGGPPVSLPRMALMLRWAVGATNNTDLSSSRVRRHRPQRRARPPPRFGPVQPVGQVRW